MAADVDGGTRRVRVELKADDYKMAVDAHRKMARVACTGQVVKAARQHELKNPRDFMLLADE